MERSVAWQFTGKQLAALIDPAGHATAVHFDRSGNLTQLRLPDATTQSSSPTTRSDVSLGAQRRGGQPTEAALRHC